MPLLSIITINLNNARGLKKTIESVTIQAFNDFEYIIIDGGSTDESVSIIKEYGGKISRWVSEKDNGIYNAMNKGIEVAAGEYCLFLNSGDSLFDRQVIKKVFDLNLKEDIWYGELIFNFESGRYQLARLPENLSLDFLYYSNLWHPAAFIKRQLFNEIGFYNETYKIAADYDFLFNAIIIHECSCKYLSFPVTVYNGEGISSRPENFNAIRTERSRIHSSYLARPVIKMIEDYHELINSKGVRFSGWLGKRPVLKRGADLIFKLYSWFR